MGRDTGVHFAVKKLAILIESMAPRASQFEFQCKATSAHSVSQLQLILQLVKVVLARSEHANNGILMRKVPLAWPLQVFLSIQWSSDVTPGRSANINSRLWDGGPLYTAASL